MRGSGAGAAVPSGAERWCGHCDGGGVSRANRGRYFQVKANPSMRYRVAFGSVARRPAPKSSGWAVTGTATGWRSAMVRSCSTQSVGARSAAPLSVASKSTAAAARGTSAASPPSAVMCRTSAGCHPRSYAPVSSTSSASGRMSDVRMYVPSVAMPQSVAEGTDTFVPSGSRTGAPTAVTRALLLSEWYTQSIDSSGRYVRSASRRLTHPCGARRFSPRRRRSAGTPATVRAVRCPARAGW